MSVLSGAHSLPPDDICAVSWTALPDLDAQHPAGTAQVGAADGATFVFAITREFVSDALASSPLVCDNSPALIRVDEVCFPVGATAYRHTHAGAGFRHLVRGALRVEADNHTQIMKPGDSWFEAARSPVRAVALHDVGVTSFVRCMVVPVEYEARSTFQLADPSDADLPRLQVTHRHFDHRFQVDAG